MNATNTSTLFWSFELNLGLFLLMFGWLTWEDYGSTKHGAKHSYPARMVSHALFAGNCLVLGLFFAISAPTSPLYTGGSESAQAQAVAVLATAVTLLVGGVVAYVWYILSPPRRPTVNDTEND